MSPRKLVGSNNELRSMNGILAVNKPSGVSSSHVVLRLQKIFNESKAFAKDLREMKENMRQQYSQGTKWSASKIDNRVAKLKIKVGHGGTLDPLASGVLIIGVGTGTKKLSYYLGECTKTYETRALLGQSTTTGDSEGELVAQTEVDGITLQDLRKAAMKFVGHIKQTPPVYSALKVDGKPLYEYAREGIPVPKAIQPREVQVISFEVHDDFGPHSAFKPLVADEKADSLGKSVFNNPTLNDHELSYSEEFMSDPDHSDSEKTTNIAPRLVDPTVKLNSLPVFHATATVGSGTYIRSLISDLGRACGSSAHMVELVRTKQSEWELGKNVFELSDFTDRSEAVWVRVLEKVFAHGESVDLTNEFAEAESRVKSEGARIANEEEGNVNDKNGEDCKKPERASVDEPQSTFPKEREVKRRKVE